MFNRDQLEYSFNKNWIGHYYKMILWLNLRLNFICNSIFGSWKNVADISVADLIFGGP